MTVTATTIDATIASRYAVAIAGKNAPASPSMKNAGSSTAATISVAKRIALRIWSVASMTTCHAGVPSPSSR